MAAPESGEKITGKELVLAGMQQPPSPAKPAAQNFSLNYNADGTAANSTVPASSPPHEPRGVGVGEGSARGCGGYSNRANSVRRKRGRPRKYGPDGSLEVEQLHAAATPQPDVKPSPSRRNFSPPAPRPSEAAAVSPVLSAASPPPPLATAAVPPRHSPAVAVAPLPPAAFPPPPAVASSPLSSSNKRPRGRAPQSWSREQPNTGALGSNITLIVGHTITVETGEDVAAKIISFCQSSPSSVTVLAASGSISNATLRDPAAFGGLTTHEGTFDILSLSGFFVLSEVAGHRRTMGSLGVVLSGNHGQTLGGSVGGLLLASSRVAVSVGVYVRIDRNEPNPENGTTPPPGTGGDDQSSSGGAGSSRKRGASTTVNRENIFNMPWK